MRMIRIVIVALILAGCTSTREVQLSLNDNALRTLNRASEHVERVESPLIGSLLTSPGAFRIESDSVHFVDSRGVATALPSRSLVVVETSTRRTGAGAATGAFAGAAVGAMTYAFMYEMTTSLASGIFGDEPEADGPPLGEVAIAAGAVGIIGAGIGALIGSGQRRVTVYRFDHGSDLTVGSNGLSLRLSLDR